MGFIKTYINGCLPPINSFNYPTCLSSESSSSCINNVYSLINYTFTLSPRSIGLVRYCYPYYS